MTNTKDIAPNLSIPTSPVAILNARKTLPKYRVTLTAPEILAILDILPSLSPNLSYGLSSALEKARATIAGEIVAAPSYTPKPRSTLPNQGPSLSALANTSLEELGEPTKDSLWEAAYAKHKAGGELSPEETSHRNEYLYLHGMMHPEDIDTFEQGANFSAREIGI